MKKFVRAISGVTLFFFTVNTLGWAAPARPQVVSSETLSFVMPARLEVPSELGSIESQNIFQNSQQPLIVHIQDAHAVTDAQASIQKLIHYFSKKYGIRLVAVEGAQGNWDPLLLKTFPEKWVREKVMKNYFVRGEMTGAEMAAVLGNDNAVYRGIEDWTLYEENFLAYLMAMEEKEPLLQVLNRLEQGADLEKTRIYSPELLTLHEMSQGFYERSEKLSEVLEFLASKSKTVPAPAHLADLLKVFQNEKHLDQKRLEKEVGALAKNFKAQFLKQLRPEAQKDFEQKQQAFSTGEMDAASFLSYLCDLGHENGIKPKLTPLMKTALQGTALSSQLKGSKIFEETESYLKALGNKAAQTPDQIKLLEKYRKLQILKDLAGLQLSRPQLAHYQENPESYLSLLGENRSKMVSALQFYKLALERDRVLHENIIKFLNQEKAQAVLVLTGGFHSPGLETFSRESGYSYASVTPAIRSLSGSENYDNLMHGKVSWGGEIRHSLYDSFMTHAAAQLKNALNTADAARTTKLWRDEIIRELARVNKLDQAGRYTAYVDGLQKQTDGNSRESILKAVDAVIDAYKKESLEKFQKNFERQLPVFMQGLSKLIGEKKLNVENVQTLLNQASAAAQIPGTVKLADIPKQQSPLTAAVFSGRDWRSFAVESGMPAAATPEAIDAALQRMAGQAPSLKDDLRIRSEALKIFEASQAAGRSESLAIDPADSLQRAVQAIRNSLSPAEQRAVNDAAIANALQIEIANLQKPRSEVRPAVILLSQDPSAFRYGLLRNSGLKDWLPPAMELAKAEPQHVEGSFKTPYGNIDFKAVSKDGVITSLRTVVLNPELRKGISDEMLRAWVLYAQQQGFREINFEISRSGPERFLITALSQWMKDPSKLKQETQDGSLFIKLPLDEVSLNLIAKSNFITPQLEAWPSEASLRQEFKAAQSEAEFLKKRAAVYIAGNADHLLIKKYPQQSLEEILTPETIQSWLKESFGNPLHAVAVQVYQDLESIRRSEVRSGEKMQAAMESLKTIEMVTLDPGLLTFTDEDAWEQRSGISPTQEGFGMFYVERDTKAFLEWLASPAANLPQVSFSPDLKNARVLILGPGMYGQEAEAFLKYPLSSLALLDAMPSNFYGIDGNLSAHLQNQEKPVIQGHLWDAAKVIPALTLPENQFDIVFVSDTIDPQFMQEDQIRSIGENLTQYLKPGGVLISAGYSFRLHDQKPWNAIQEQAYQRLEVPNLAHPDEVSFFYKNRSEVRDGKKVEFTDRYEASLAGGWFNAGMNLKEVLLNGAFLEESFDKLNLLPQDRRLDSASVETLAGQNKLIFRITLTAAGGEKTTLVLYRLKNEYLQRYQEADKIARSNSEMDIYPRVGTSVSSDDPKNGWLSVEDLDRRKSGGKGYSHEIYLRAGAETFFKMIGSGMTLAEPGISGQYTFVDSGTGPHAVIHDLDLWKSIALPEDSPSLAASNYSYRIAKILASFSSSEVTVRELLRSAAARIKPEYLILAYSSYHTMTYAGKRGDETVLTAGEILETLGQPVLDTELLRNFLDGDKWLSFNQGILKSVIDSATASRSENRQPQKQRWSDEDNVYKKEFLTYIRGGHQDLALDRSVEARLRNTLETLLDRYDHYGFDSRESMWADIRETLWEKQKTLEAHLADDKPVNPYIETTVWHALIDHWREIARKTSSEISIADMLAEIEDTHESGALSNIIHKEDRSFLNRAIRSLPEEEQVLINRHFVQGMTYEQMGKRYGITEAAVHYRMNKALEHLRHLYVDAPAVPKRQGSQEPQEYSILSSDVTELDRVIGKLRTTRHGVHEQEETEILHSMMRVYQNGASIKQIAERFNIPEGTVKRRIHTAIAAIEKANSHLVEVLKQIRANHGGQIHMHHARKSDADSSEQRSESRSTQPIEQKWVKAFGAFTEGKTAEQSRKLFFDRPAFVPSQLSAEDKAVFLALVPKALLDHFEFSPDRNYWETDREKQPDERWKEGNSISKVTRIEGDAVRFELSTVKNGSRVKIADVSLTENGQTLHIADGFLKKFPETAAHQNSISRYWLNENVTPFASAFGFKAISIWPIALGTKKLRALGFKGDEKDDISLWTYDLYPEQPEVRSESRGAAYPFETNFDYGIQRQGGRTIISVGAHRFRIQNQDFQKLLTDKKIKNNFRLDEEKDGAFRQVPADQKKYREFLSYLILNVNQTVETYKKLNQSPKIQVVYKAGFVHIDLADGDFLKFRLPDGYVEFKQRGKPLVTGHNADVPLLKKLLPIAWLTSFYPIIFGSEEDRENFLPIIGRDHYQVKQSLIFDSAEALSRRLDAEFGTETGRLPRAPRARELWPKKEDILLHKELTLDAAADYIAPGQRPGPDETATGSHLRFIKTDRGGRENTRDLYLLEHSPRGGEIVTKYEDGAPVRLTPVSDEEYQRLFTSTYQDFRSTPLTRDQYLAMMGDPEQLASFGPLNQYARSLEEMLDNLPTLGPMIEGGRINFLFHFLSRLSEIKSPFQGDNLLWRFYYAETKQSTIPRRFALDIDVTEEYVYMQVNDGLFVRIPRGNMRIVEFLAPAHLLKGDSNWKPVQSASFFSEYIATQLGAVNDLMSTPGWMALQYRRLMVLALQDMGIDIPMDEESLGWGMAQLPRRSESRAKKAAVTGDPVRPQEYAAWHKWTTVTKGGEDIFILLERMTTEKNWTVAQTIRSMRWLSNEPPPEGLHVAHEMDLQDSKFLREKAGLIFFADGNTVTIAYEDVGPLPAPPATVPFKQRSESRGTAKSLESWLDSMKGQTSLAAVLNQAAAEINGMDRAARQETIQRLSEFVMSVQPVSSEMIKKAKNVWSSDLRDEVSLVAQGDKSIARQDLQEYVRDYASLNSLSREEFEPVFMFAQALFKINSDLERQSEFKTVVTAITLASLLAAGSLLAKMAMEHLALQGVERGVEIVQEKIADNRQQVQAERDKEKALAENIARGLTSDTEEIRQAFIKRFYDKSIDDQVLIFQALQALYSNLDPEKQNRIWDFYDYVLTQDATYQQSSQHVRFAAMASALRMDPSPRRFTALEKGLAASFKVETTVNPNFGAGGEGTLQLFTIRMMLEEGTPEALNVLRPFTPSYAEKGFKPRDERVQRFITEAAGRLESGQQPASRSESREQIDLSQLVKIGEIINGEIVRFGATPLTLREAGGNYAFSDSIGELYPLREGINTLGRQEGQMIHLSSGMVSRQHAVIQVNGNVVTVYDRNSTQGTEIIERVKTNLEPKTPDNESFEGVFVGEWKVGEAFDFGGAVRLTLLEKGGKFSVRNELSNEVYPLKNGDNTLGRSNGQDIQFATGLISRQHAIIQVDEADGRVFVFDLNTRNGTEPAKRSEVRKIGDIEILETAAFANRILPSIKSIGQSDQDSRVLVADGFDWTKSGLEQAAWPVVFHGTVKEAVPSVSKKGIRTADNPVEKADFDFLKQKLGFGADNENFGIEDRLRRGHVSATLNFSIAASHAQKGPEIINKLLYLMALNLKVNEYTPEDRRKIEDLFVKYWNYTIKSEPIIFVVQMPLDVKSIHDVSGSFSKFFTGEETVSKILDQSNPVNPLNFYLGNPYQFLLTIRRERPDLPVSAAIEDFFRDQNYEIEVSEIPAGKVLGYVRVNKRNHESFIDTFNLLSDALKARIEPLPVETSGRSESRSDHEVFSMWKGQDLLASQHDFQIYTASFLNARLAKQVRERFFDESEKAAQKRHGIVTEEHAAILKIVSLIPLFFPGWDPRQYDARLLELSAELSENPEFIDPRILDSASRANVRFIFDGLIRGYAGTAGVRSWTSEDARNVYSNSGYYVNLDFNVPNPHQVLVTISNVTGSNSHKFPYVGGIVDQTLLMHFVPRIRHLNSLASRQPFHFIHKYLDLSLRNTAFTLWAGLLAAIIFGPQVAGWFMTISKGILLLASGFLSVNLWSASSRTREALGDLKYSMREQARLEYIPKNSAEADVITARSESRPREEDEKPSYSMPRDLAFVVNDGNKTVVTWSIVPHPFDLEELKRQSKTWPLFSSLSERSLESDHSMRVMAAGNVYRKLGLQEVKNYLKTSPVTFRINGWEYRIDGNQIAVTNPENKETYQSQDPELIRWLSTVIQALMGAALVTGKTLAASFRHEFAPDFYTEVAGGEPQKLDRATREIENPSGLFDTKLNLKAAYVVAEIEIGQTGKPILNLPSDDAFYAKIPGSTARSESRRSRKPADQSGFHELENFKQGLPFAEADIRRLELTRSVVSSMVIQIPLLFDAVESEGLSSRIFGGAVRGLAFATQFIYPLPISELDVTIPSGLDSMMEDIDKGLKAQAKYEAAFEELQKASMQIIKPLHIHITLEPVFRNIIWADREWSVSKFWLTYDREHQKYFLEAHRQSVDDLKAKRLRFMGQSFNSPGRIPKLLDQAIEYLRFGFTVDPASIEMIETELKDPKYETDANRVHRQAALEKLDVLKDRLKDQKDHVSIAESKGTDIIKRWAFNEDLPELKAQLQDLVRRYEAGRLVSQDSTFKSFTEARYFTHFQNGQSPWVLKGPRKSIPVESIYTGLETAEQIGRGIFVPFQLIPAEEVLSRNIVDGGQLANTDPSHDWILQEQSYSLTDILTYLHGLWKNAGGGVEEEKILLDIENVIVEWRRMIYRSWALGTVLSDYTFETAGLTKEGKVLQSRPSFNLSWQTFFNGSTSVADLANSANLKWLSDRFGNEVAAKLFGEGLVSSDFDRLWPSNLDDLSDNETAIAFDERKPVLDTAARDAMRTAFINYAASISPNQNRSEAREQTEAFAKAVAALIDDPQGNEVIIRLLQRAIYETRPDDVNSAKRVTGSPSLLNPAVSKNWNLDAEQAQRFEGFQRVIESGKDMHLVNRMVRLSLYDMSDLGLLTFILKDLTRFDSDTRELINEEFIEVIRRAAVEGKSLLLRMEDGHLVPARSESRGGNWMIEEIIEKQLGIPRNNKTLRTIRILDLGTWNASFLVNIRKQLGDLGYKVEAVGVDRDNFNVKSKEGFFHAELQADGTIKGMGVNSDLHLEENSFDLVFINAPTMQKLDKSRYEMDFQVWINAYKKYGADQSVAILRRATDIEEIYMYREESALIGAAAENKDLQIHYFEYDTDPKFVRGVHYLSFATMFSKQPIQIASPKRSEMRPVLDEWNANYQAFKRNLKEEQAAYEVPPGVAGHMALQWRGVSFQNGPGSIYEFDFLKNVFSKIQDPEAPKLASVNYANLDDIEKMLTFLADAKHIISPSQKEALLAAAREMDKTAIDSRRPEFFTDKNLEGVLEAHYKSSSLVFAAMPLIVEELYRRRYATAFPAAETNLDDRFQVQKDNSLHFDLERGYVEEERKEISLRQDITDQAAFIRQHPEALFQAFVYASQHQLPLSHSLRRLIWDYLAEFKILMDPAQTKPGNAQALVQGEFLRLLGSEKSITPALWQMQRLGVLDAYSEDFAAVNHLPSDMWVHDFSHQFTVGQHTLHNLQMFDEVLLSGKKIFAEAHRETGVFTVDQRLTMRLSLFYHDLGKSKRLYDADPDHAIRAAQQIVPVRLREMGLTGSEIEPVMWLVRNHMMLNEFSRQKKLDFAHALPLFMQTILADPTFTPEKLKLLFVMSMTDRFSVSPWRLDAVSFTVSIGELEQIMLSIRDSEITLSPEQSEVLSKLNPKMYDWYFSLGHLKELFEAILKFWDSSAAERLETIKLMKQNAAFLEERQTQLFRDEFKPKLQQALGQFNPREYWSQIPVAALKVDELQTGLQTRLDEIATNQAKFDAVFERYLTAFPVSELETFDLKSRMQRFVFLVHLEMLQEMGIQAPLVLFSPRYDRIYEKQYEIIVGLPKDQPGTFFNITGAFFAHGFNIQGASARTTEENIVVDRFYGFYEGDESAGKLQEKIWDSVSKLFDSGNPVTVAQIFSQLGIPYRVNFPEIFQPTKINFLQDGLINGHTVSAFSIQTSDRIGLLHAVAAVLKEENMNLVSAPITTNTGLGNDMFMVDFQGNALTGAQKQELEISLKQILDQRIIDLSSISRSESRTDKIPDAIPIQDLEGLRALINWIQTNSTSAYLREQMESPNQPVQIAIYGPSKLRITQFPLSDFWAKLYGLNAVLEHPELMQGGGNKAVAEWLQGELDLAAETLQEFHPDIEMSQITVHLEAGDNKKVLFNLYLDFPEHPALTKEDFLRIPQEGRDLFGKVFTLWYPYLFADHTVEPRKLELDAQRRERLGLSKDAQIFREAALERIAQAGYLIRSQMGKLSEQEMANEIEGLFRRAGQDFIDSKATHLADEAVWQEIGRIDYGMQVLAQYAKEAAAILISKYQPVRSESRLIQLPSEMGRPLNAFAQFLGLNDLRQTAGSRKEETSFTAPEGTLFAGSKVEIYSYETEPIQGNWSDRAPQGLPALRELFSSPLEAGTFTFNLKVVMARVTDSDQKLIAEAPVALIPSTQGIKTRGYLDLTPFWVPEALLRSFHLEKKAGDWEKFGAWTKSINEKVQAASQLPALKNDEPQFALVDFDSLQTGRLQAMNFRAEAFLESDKLKNPRTFFSNLKFGPASQVLFLGAFVYSPANRGNKDADQDFAGKAQALINAYPSANDSVKVVDLGTGSGYMSLVAAKKIQANGKQPDVTSIDVSAYAAAAATVNLETAGFNAKVYVGDGVDQEFISKIIGPGSVDLFISNTPYLKNSMVQELPTPEQLQARSNTITEAYDGGTAGLHFWLHLPEILKYAVKPQSGLALLWHFIDFTSYDPAFGLISQTMQSSARYGVKPVPSFTGPRFNTSTNPTYIAALSEMPAWTKPVTDTWYPMPYTNSVDTTLRDYRNKLNIGTGRSESRLGIPTKTEAIDLTAIRDKVKDFENLGTAVDSDQVQLNGRTYRNVQRHIYAIELRDLNHELFEALVRSVQQNQPVAEDSQKILRKPHPKINSEGYALPIVRDILTEALRAARSESRRQSIRYREVYSDPLERFFREYQPRHYREPQETRQIRIFDAATGDAAFMEPFHTALQGAGFKSENITIAGVDIAGIYTNYVTEMLQKTGKKLTFIEGDMSRPEKLNLPAHSFDVVMFNAPDLRYIQKYGDFADWLKTADHFLKDDGLIMVRLYNYERDPRNLRKPRQYTEKAKILMPILEKSKDFRIVKHFVQGETPQLPMGYHTVGPIILLQRRREPDVVSLSSLAIPQAIVDKAQQGGTAAVEGELKKAAGAESATFTKNVEKLRSEIRELENSAALTGEFISEAGTRNHLWDPQFLAGRIVKEALAAENEISSQTLENVRQFLDDSEMMAKISAEHKLSNNDHVAVEAQLIVALLDRIKNPDAVRDAFKQNFASTKVLTGTQGYVGTIRDLVKGQGASMQQVAYSDQNPLDVQDLKRGEESLPSVWVQDGTPFEQKTLREGLNGITMDSDMVYRLARLDLTPRQIVAFLRLVPGLLKAKSDELFRLDMKSLQAGLEGLALRFEAEKQARERIQSAA